MQPPHLESTRKQWAVPCVKLEQLHNQREEKNNKVVTHLTPGQWKLDQIVKFQNFSHKSSRRKHWKMSLSS